MSRFACETSSGARECPLVATIVGRRPRRVCAISSVRSTMPHPCAARVRRARPVRARSRNSNRWCPLENVADRLSFHDRRYAADGVCGSSSGAQGAGALHVRDACAGRGRGGRAGRRRISIRDAGESRRDVRPNEGFLRPHVLCGARPPERPALRHSHLRGRLRAVAARAGTQAAAQIDRIATGWRLRPVAPPLIVCTHAQSPESISSPKKIAAEDLARCAELGATLAAGIALGIF
jgi:hypothetical protein